MSAYASQPTRSRALTIDAVKNSVGVFDADAWHVMDQRDNEMIRQELIHGVGSSKFVYQFPIAGSGTVTGISVVGARQLAAKYGGLKHRLIASVSKIGSLFTFTSYPQPNMPMHVSAQVIDMLKDEDDYYEVVIEVDDIKTGNSVQVRKRESAQESRRDGSKFDRQHYSVIAESKALRNAYLSLIDQAVQIEWKMRMIELGKDEVITGSVLDEKRSNVLRFAASKSIPIDRRNIEALTFDQLAGLGDAARAGGVDEFRRAAEALHVVAMPEVVTQTAAAAAAPARIAQTAASAPASSVVQQQPAAAQPTPTSTPQQSPTFEAHLADEFGEAAADQPFTIPGGFLMALLNLCRKSSNVQALLEGNADGIADARAADPHVGATFDAEIAGLRKPVVQEQAADPLVLAMPMRGTRQDLQGYVEGAREAYGRCTTMEQITAWDDANSPTIKPLPTSIKLAIRQARDARVAALQPQQEPAVTGTDLHSSVRDDLIAEITSTQTLSDLQTMENIRSVVLRRDRLPPEMRDEVYAATRAHHDRLQQGGAD